MPSLLLEIGCEELPASACYEAERQLPRLCAEHFGAEPAELFIGPRRLAALLHDLPERTEPAWIKGPPEAMRERAAAGFARRHGVDPGELEVREGFLGIEQPGRALRDVLPESIDAVVRGLAFNRTMRWDDSGLRYPRPVRWVLAKLDEDTLQRRALLRPPLHAWAGGHPRRRGRTRTRLRDAARRAGRGGAASPIVEALPEGWSDPAGVLDEVVHLVEWPDRPGERLRSRGSSTSPRGTSSSLPCSHTSATSRSRATASPSSRTAATRTSSAPATRKSWRTGWTTPPSASSATSRWGSTAWPRASGNLVLRRRRNVRRQGRALAEAGRTARWGRGDARGGAPGQGGPGLRARARVPGAGGPHRRRVRAPGWVSRGSVRRHRPSNTFQIRGRRARFLDRERPRPLRSGQDRHAHHFVLPGPPADGLARPLWPAARGDRALPARHRGRVSRFRAGTAGG